jgi:hypothetical protein
MPMSILVSYREIMPNAYIFLVGVDIETEPLKGGVNIHGLGLGLYYRHTGSHGS